MRDIKVPWYSRLDDHLQDRALSVGVEVRELDALSLLAQCELLEVGRYEGCALVGVLDRDVLGNGTALVKDEAIIILFQDRIVMS